VNRQGRIAFGEKVFDVIEAEPDRLRDALRPVTALGTIRFCIW
jgi:hypothetical protein